MLNPTEYTPAEIEHLGDEEFAELFFGALRPRAPEPAPTRPDETELITAAVQGVREAVEECTRHFGIEGRRLVIKMLKKQLLYEAKTLL
jgi:hypothetical protein